MNHKKIVIKIGSNVLASKKNYLDVDFLCKFVEQIYKIHNKGVKIILVSSGAVMAAGKFVDFKNRAKKLPQKQVLAAVGQVKLMDIYQNLFSKKGILVAQALLTKNDFISRESFLNTRGTLELLLKQNIIPIINENDVSATQSLEFGGNDLLSAQIAVMLDADLLVNLSSVNGFCKKDPNICRDTELIKEIKSIDYKLEDLAKRSTGKYGKGGMTTKLQAAKLVALAGIPMIIANGKKKNILDIIIKGQNPGSYFYPISSRKNSFEHWMIINSKDNAGVIIDKGAKKVLTNKGKSLLPVGVLDIIGQFKRGEATNIFYQKNKIGCGQVEYDSDKLKMIIGKNSAKIKKLFGCQAPEEVIHRDNMVIY